MISGTVLGTGEKNENKQGTVPALKKKNSTVERRLEMYLKYTKR